ncbi:MAG: hypothetical protein PHU21_09035 [Elusimicrobia bacterium]|nr:hypothetical protein [Elusimicrobiota bacterium]
MPRAVWVLLFLFPAPAAASSSPDSDSLRRLHEGFAKLRSRTSPAAPEGIVCSQPFRVDSHVRGAYFRKVESVASTRYAGIRAEVLLPLVQFDPDRSFSPGPGQPAHWEGPLDRPSVYVGAHTSAKEVDAGLTWDRVYDEEGRPAFTDLPSGCDGGDRSHRFSVSRLDGRRLRPDFAFRPFWRTTAGQGNQWHNPPAGDPNYFYPGQSLVVALRVRTDGTMRLDIRPARGTGRHFTKAFPQEGFADGQESSFKRVASIDQFRVAGGSRRGNEGMDVLPTRTSVKGMVWSQVFLLTSGRPSKMSGSTCREVAGADTAKDYAVIFSINPDRDGGESLDIRPPQP